MSDETPLSLRRRASDRLGAGDRNLYDLVSDLIVQMNEQHERTNQRMAEGFKGLKAQFDSHAIEDRKVADDVLIIKTQRAQEAAEALKRTTLTSVVVAGAVTATGWVIQHVWK